MSNLNSGKHSDPNAKKKLTVLKTQLYGKEPEDRLPRLNRDLHSSKSNSDSNQSVFTFTATKRENGNLQSVKIPQTETEYVKHELFKIALLASIAIVFQLGLYFGLQSGLLKLPI